MPSTRCPSPPFHSKLINAGDRDTSYVLDGLLYYESDQEIQEHYTDAAGFTDRFFALMPLLDHRFAPRIRNIGDTRLYTPPQRSCVVGVGSADWRHH